MFYNLVARNTVKTEGVSAITYFKSFLAKNSYLLYHAENVFPQLGNTNIIS